MGRYVVKLGSNIVADDGGALREDVMRSVCGRIAERHRAGDDFVVVSSGAIARGMEAMGLSERPASMADLQAASAVGQGRLYRVWDGLLSAEGLSSAQVLLTLFDVGHRAHYLNARQTLGRLLDWRVVPVVNENDTTATEEISFGDNDFLAAQVAILCGAARLVLLTNQDGLHERDPRQDPDAPLVEVVEDPQELEAYAIGQAPSGLGSGGMRSKVVAAEMATAAGIPTVICNGLTEGALDRAMDGEREGTRFSARDLDYSSFELWLRYAKPTSGQITIDDGAAKALRSDGASLLPVGVVGVGGSFGAGDAVEIVSGGAVVAKGIAAIGSEELAVLAGMRSADADAHLGRPAGEAVHRDMLVLV